MMRQNTAMTTVHVVQHTHWDQEWYFTAEDAVVLSDQVLTEALEELSRNRAVNFCLDGQISFLDAYVALNPQMLPHIRKLIKEGRLFVGPWYTQTDALLVGSESILHNLMIGIHEARRVYGEPMMIGYLPDTFGFTAQLPTILKHAGIEEFIGWRGISFKTNVSEPYFIWRGLGVQSVFAAMMPHGYLSGMMCVEALDYLDEFVRSKLDRETSFVSGNTRSAHVLMPSGIDQKSMLLDFDRIVAAYNEKSLFTYLISSYPKFMEYVRICENLPSYQGELREPAYARVHRSIASVRTRIKQENFLLEQKILRRVEPMLVIGRAVGIRVSNGLLIRLWKYLLKNQAHDSMGGCVSDDVASDIVHRVEKAHEIADGIENLIARRIADALQLTDHHILVFNTSASAFCGEKIVHVVTHSKNIRFPDCVHAVVEREKFHPARKDVRRVTGTTLEMIEEKAYYELDVRVFLTLPPLGYRVIRFEEHAAPLEQYKSDTNASSVASISNDMYTIAFNHETITLKTNDGRIFEDLIVLTDAANDGDTYDYSPYPGDFERVLRFSKAKKRTATGREELILTGSADLPVDLEDRKPTAGRTRQVTYRMSLALGDGELIEGRVHVDNQVFSHRMRLRVVTHDASGSSIAQIQNGFLRRTRKDVSDNWRDCYVEKPVPIEIFDKSVSVANEQGALTVFADGIKEYEREGSYLYLTLFATTAQLGKPNLAWRPGRASGDTTDEGHVMVAVPAAQEIGNHVVSFALRISKDEFDELLTARYAEQRLQPSISYQKQSLNLFVRRLDNKIWREQYLTNLPSHFSVGELMGELPDSLIVSCIMPSFTQSDAFIVRISNPCALAYALPDSLCRKAVQVNALEESKEKASKIFPYDFVTLSIQLPHF